MRSKSAGPSRRDGVPSTVMSPRSGRRMFISMRIVVVLPVPLAPISANTAPSGTRRLRSSMASKRPKRFATWRVSTIMRHRLESAQVGPGVFHRPLDFIETRAHAHRFHDELLDLVLEQTLSIAGTRLRRLRDHRAHAGLRGQPAFLDQ